MYSWIRGSGDELFMDTVRKEITMELVEYWKNELDDHRKMAQPIQSVCYQTVGKFIEKPARSGDLRSYPSTLFRVKG